MMTDAEHVSLPAHVSAALSVLAHCRFVDSPTIAVGRSEIVHYPPRVLTRKEQLMRAAACDVLRLYFMRADGTDDASLAGAGENGAPDHERSTGADELPRGEADD